MTTIPASVPADGNLRVVWNTVLTSLTAPVATELNAGLNLSWHLTDDGWRPTVDEAVVTDERLASVKTFEQPGRVADHLTIRYVINPASPGNDAARLALPYKQSGFLTSRVGVDEEAAFAAGDIVSVVPGIAGTQVEDPKTANGVITVTQRIFIPAPGVSRWVTVG